MRRCYVYMVRCRDGTLYTGWTFDPERRLREHNSGKGARYTRSRTPVELVYLEDANSRAEALARERKIKSLGRASKLRLVRKDQMDSYR